MTSRFFTIVTLATLAALTAASAVPPLHASRLPVAAGNAPLHVFGGRNAEQSASPTASKFDAALADVSRHLSSVRPDHAVGDLHALNPAARFTLQTDNSQPLVLIDAVTRGDPQALKAALLELGLQRASVYSNDVGGWLPVAQLDAAAASAEVDALRAAMPRTRSGAVTTQGDFVQHSDMLRANTALTGAGVTVGILSDSYDCYPIYAANKVSANGTAGYAPNGFTATAAQDISSGDLPAAASITVLSEANCLNYDPGVLLPFGDEGRAMMQIVHDVAPGASLAFYTAENSEADFAAGIGKLAAQGAKVIADDVGYFDEPFFQDGIVAQAIDSVEAQGVAYFSAAGNDGTLGYDNAAPSFATLSSTAPNSGEHLLNFDTSGATTTTALPVKIPGLEPGEFVGIVLEWDQPFVTGAAGSGGATSQMDLCITGATGGDEIVSNNLQALPSNCTGANSLGGDPVQILVIGNPSSATANSAVETINVVVGLVSGTTPGRIKLVIEDDGAGSAISRPFAQAGAATLQGHPGAGGAMAVGAARYYDTPACGAAVATLEPYSSYGGSPILFDVSGRRLAAAVPRQKPDLVGPDGGNDTFLGRKDNDPASAITGCQNNTSYPNFLGTSAATPHVASIAALMLQANPALTPTAVYTALRSSALPMSAITPNFASGYGFVQAAAAFAQLPAVAPPAPTLILAATSITLGASTTLTWSAVNATGCTASGGWSGALAISGVQTLVPATAGTASYSLACSNAAGTSAPQSVSLTVVAPASKSGGGSMQFGGLLGLAALHLIAYRHRRRLALRRCSSNRP